MLQRVESGRMPLLVQHRQEFGEQFGRVLGLEAAKKGLTGEVEVFGWAPERLHKMLDAGLMSVSIGFKPLRNNEIETDMGLVLESTQWELDELSLVAVGACRAARLTKEVT